MTVNECDVFLDNVMLIEVAGDYEFATWIDNVPVVEQTSEGGSGEVRRRAEIF